MDRQDIIKRLLYPKCKTAIEFKFDSLLANPLLSYITIQDIAQLNKIATSLKYSSKPKEKYAMIDSIMTNRGFKKMASGTNRVTYRCLNDYSIVIKIAIDKVGLSDNGNEMRNQHLLKPFVTKCFEISPCGTVGLFERVVPITSREEFINISDDIFDLINNLIGKYVLEDIGEKFYMNYGLREGFGPVLLDYPYVFELDGRKLICNVPEPLEPKGYCGGEIDYDIGYNNLVCKKCGKRYLATDLKSDVKSSDKPKIIVEGEDMIMRCRLVRGDEVVSKLNSNEPISTNTIRSKRDFTNLKAHLGVAQEEEKKEYVRPEIKTRDDVQLRARLRGKRTGEDIDKVERIKEAKAEKIPVSFEPEAIPVKLEETRHLTVSLSGGVEETYETVKVNEVEDKETDKLFDTIEVVIKDNGEIVNIDTHEVIGYTVKETNKRVYDEFEKHTQPDSDYYETDNTESTEEESNSDLSTDVEDVSVYKVESSGNTIADLLGDKLDAFKGSYTKSDVVEPIESHFAQKEEPNEIPEVIIHPRDEEKEDLIGEY